jgi:pimeloyl-ACP methyl ester carboxylesterase
MMIPAHAGTHSLIDLKEVVVRELERRQFLAMMAAGLVSPRLLSAHAVDPRLPIIDWSELLQDPSLARQREYLAVLRRVVGRTQPVRSDRINAKGDRTFEEWQERTGELPPDFQLMKSSAGIPDPLIMLGERTPRRITTPAEWRQQRTKIKGLLDHWLLGKMPPSPGNVRGVITETTVEGDCTVQQIRLEFGPEFKATLRLLLYVPHGDGPFPVLLTNHQRLRPWVNHAVRRGYIGCIYEAIDSQYGLPDDSRPWQELYPEHDFSTLARWAWGGMRAVDYLFTLPNVDRKRIAIGGHSRNSKQALIAAAYDERIGAVVASRGNSGDVVPWRFSEDWYNSEPLEEITRGFAHWYHPRLRFFVGREHKLPFDQNFLCALVAPRGLLMSHAYMEHQGNPLGVEQSYRSVRDVYKLLGEADNVGLMQEPGEHPNSAEDVQKYFDFIDTVFGRKQFPHPETWIHGYTFSSWLQRSAERIAPQRFPQRSAGDYFAVKGATPTPETWPQRKDDIRKAITWVMGDEPPHISFPFGAARGIVQVSEGWQGDLVSRSGSREFPYGDELVARLYLPPAPPGLLGAATQWSGSTLRTANLPVVVWLHPYSYATGYSREPYWAPLVARGFAVLAFDQIGFGTRTGQATRFYQRHPRWSLLGKMVADTRALLDGIFARGGQFDRKRIYLKGYALGAKVGLFTAALDDRVTAVSASCGFSPLREVSHPEDIEGLRHYSHLHGLLPRLGFFLGHETRVPVDYDEIVAAVAPRPAQIIAPTIDRHAAAEDVTRVVNAARRAYELLGNAAALELETPEDFTRYPNMQMRQIDWLTRQAGLPIPLPEPGKDD